jgi:hypothetical protein
VSDASGSFCTAWHHRIAAPADRDVERRSRAARIGQAGREADLLDEGFRIEGGLDLTRRFPAPASIAMLFHLG